MIEKVAGVLLVFAMVWVVIGLLIWIPKIREPRNEYYYRSISYIDLKELETEGFECHTYPAQRLYDPHLDDITEISGYFACVREGKESR